MALLVPVVALVPVANVPPIAGDGAWKSVISNFSPGRPSIEKSSDCCLRVVRHECATGPHAGDGWANPDCNLAKPDPQNGRVHAVSGLRANRVAWGGGHCVLATRRRRRSPSFGR